MKKEHDDPIDATWFEAGPKVSRAEGWGGVIAGALALVVAVAVAVMAFAAPAGAQQPAPCAPREEIRTALAADPWGETATNVGIMSTGAVMEVYTNRATGTWSVLILRPDGIACLVASGEAWIDVPVVEIVAPSDPT